MRIAPTGITISFGGDTNGLRESRPVVARIFGFADGMDKPVTHEMVVPAGQTIEQRLAQGLYSVELTLSSGRIIKRNVRIDEDSNETFRFLDDFAERSGFSLQDAVAQSSSQILAEAAAIAGAPPTAPQELPPQQEVGGLKGLVRRLQRRSLTAVPSASSDVKGPFAARLALCRGWDDRILSEPPIGTDWTYLEPIESAGVRALWRVSHAAHETPGRSSRKWAKVERADGGTEVASLPLPWMCTGNHIFAEADILVDPDRSAGAATTVAVNDVELAGLLAFLDQGQSRAARPMLQELDQKNVIEQTINSKMFNPLAACAAAYVGLAVYPASQNERWDSWLENCMVRFPDVPDSAIVHARRLILRPSRSGDQANAANALRQAHAAGIPYFSTGVFLLREMLLQLSAEHDDFAAMAADVGRLAGRVDASQIFTVLRYAPVQGGQS